MRKRINDGGKKVRVPASIIGMKCLSTSRTNKNFTA